jgi:hypothetical protein
VLESDFYRYLWDGHVLAQGINPYLYAPHDPALDGVDTLYRVYIGWAQFRTIYPPVAQYLFALSSLVAPGSLLALKCSCVGLPIWESTRDGVCSTF